MKTLIVVGGPEKAIPEILRRECRVRHYCGERSPKDFPTDADLLVFENRCDHAVARPWMAWAKRNSIPRIAGFTGWHNVAHQAKKRKDTKWISVLLAERTIEEPGEELREPEERKDRTMPNSTKELTKRQQDKRDAKALRNDITAVIMKAGRPLTLPEIRDELGLGSEQTQQIGSQLKRNFAQCPATSVNIEHAMRLTKKKPLWAWWPPNENPVLPKLKRLIPSPCVPKATKQATPQATPPMDGLMHKIERLRALSKEIEDDIYTLIEQAGGPAMELAALRKQLRQLANTDS